MELQQVSALEYKDLIPKHYHIFNTTDFTLLNEKKVAEVTYLVFKDSKIRAGIILGIEGEIAKSPFSAPYGGFSYIHEDIKIYQIDQVLGLFDNWLKNQGILEVSLTLPPFFYHENYLTKMSNSLWRASYEIKNQDINYQFDTSGISEDYLSRVWKNARKNLKRANSVGFDFQKLGNDLGKQAYDVIRQNRQERNLPLKMSWEQVKATTETIKTDYFLTNLNGVAVAAAIVFHVADNIVQVVYWGDLPEYSENKTMNFLSFKVFEFYNKSGIKYVDIGPSTENSYPNHGLCEFKESIGCDLSLKQTFYKKIQS